MEFDINKVNPNDKHFKLVVAVANFLEDDKCCERKECGECHIQNHCEFITSELLKLYHKE